MKTPCLMLLAIVMAASSQLPAAMAQQARPDAQNGQAARTVTVSGRVMTTDTNEPLAGAYIIINADAAGYASRTSLTDGEGRFSVTTREASPVLTIKYPSYQTIARTIDNSQRTVALGDVRLSPEAIEAAAVTVAAKAPLAILKGDTVQYAAANFKTNPDANTEDLLKKMPGVTTDDDGNVQVNGQSIGKVYVDGKEYFSEDPAMALKNLPADVVQSMQTFEERTDESKFSGFDDGTRLRAVNVVTKSGVAHSVFGKVYAGYGTDDRYAAGLGANIFMGDHRLTVTGQSNNVNNQGFTLQDVAQASSGRGGGQFATSVRGGIQQTNAAGLNYNGQFKDKLKLSAAYNFNNVNSDRQRTRQQTFLNTPRVYSDTSYVNGYNFAHSLYARAEWTPDSTNRLTFSPRVTYNTNHGDEYSAASTLQNGLLSNNSKSEYGNAMGAYNAGANLWWNHRLPSKIGGRTFSVGGNGSASNQWGSRTQSSVYGSLDDFGNFVPENLDQYYTLGGASYSWSGRATYNEPLSRTSRLSLSYNYSYNSANSDKLGYEWDQALQVYDMNNPDPLTSNVFTSNRTRQETTLGYNYVKDKINLNASVGYQWTTLQDIEKFPLTSDDKYNFRAWTPRLRFEYKPTKTKSLTVDYNRRTGLPSIEQLQQVVDLSNPLQVFIGDPGLDQSTTDALNIRFLSPNIEKSTMLVLNANVNFTQDYIAYDRTFLAADRTLPDGTVIPKGAQVTAPVNMDGYVSANMGGFYSFRIPAIKSAMNTGLNYNYTHSPSIENSIRSSVNNNTFGGFVSLTSNISEKVDFTLRYSASLRFNEGSSGTFNRYVTSNLGGFLNVYLVGGLFINADATWRNNVGTDASADQHYAMVNAGIGYKFLANRQAEFRLTGNDLLNQNRAIFQNSYDTYTQLSTTNVLKRYFMLSFTYKFDTRKGRSAKNYGTSEETRPPGPGGPMMMRPGGGPGGGYGGGGGFGR